MPQAEWHPSMWSNRLSMALIHDLLVIKFTFTKCIFPDYLDDNTLEIQMEAYFDAKHKQTFPTEKVLNA